MYSVKDEPLVEAPSVVYLSHTLQWMSGDMTTIRHDSRAGLYWIKRMILSMMKKDGLNPFLLLLYTKTEEGEWVEYTAPTIDKDTHFYAVVRQPIIHERLEFVYPIGEDEIWRFTYQPVNGGAQRIQLSMVVHDGEWFCGINAFTEARQQRMAIPWVHTVETFLEAYRSTEQGVALGEQAMLNLIYLWNHRRH